MIERSVSKGVRMSVEMVKEVHMFEGEGLK